MPSLRRLALAGSRLAVACGLLAACAGPPAASDPAAPGAAASGPVASGPAASGPASPAAGSPAAGSPAWSERAVEVPAALPGGAQYGVVRVLGDGRLVVTDLAGGSTSTGIWVWTPATGDLRLIDGSAQQGGISLDVAANDRWVAWQASPRLGSTGDVWIAPVDGTGARKLATGAVIGFLDLVDDDVWITQGRPPDTTGVSVLPGTRTRPDLRSYDAQLGWPWYGKRDATHDLDDQILLNADTGEKRTANPGALKYGSCSLTWCVGHRGSAQVAEARDGSAAWPLPGATADDRLPIAADRFVRYNTASTLMLADLRTHRTEQLAARPELEARGATRSVAPEIVVWHDGPDTVRILDLTRI
ncbi:hypothetical protein [Cryptosporangium sp. NPDC048952]|uniref:hypothetical protein n=1 Tax=Cryptosporangium sp. NPDC048952 TaxID=3363961 RepID=UPI00371A78C9